jgi:hypothetical protein
VIHEQVALEIAIIERQCFAAVREKLAARQLGEAWVGLDGMLHDERRSEARD